MATSITPTVGSRVDATPTDHELYAAATRAGLTPDAASALIHARRGQAAPRALWGQLNATGVAPDVTTKLVQYATGLAPGQSAPAPSAATPGASETFGDHAINGMSLNWLPKMDAAAHVVTDPAVEAYRSAPGSLLAKIAEGAKAFAYQPAESDAARYNDRLAADRAYLKREHDAHPVASTAGEITGSLISPVNELAAGAPALGALRAVKAGAIIGGTSALGADDSGDVTSKLMNAGVGAGVGGAVGGLLGTIANRFGRNDAGERITSALKTEAMTTPAVVAAGTQPSMLADLVPNLTRAVRSAGAGPASVVDAALAARGARQLPVIQSALEDGLGIVRGDAGASTDAIIGRRAAAAKPLYTSAYAGPDVSHPEIESAMKLPAFQAAYAKARQLAAIEGTPIPAQSGGSMSVRALDYLKRGLNDVIDAGTRGGTMARGEARALSTRLRSVLDATDSQAPAFAAARQSFAGHTALLDAAENGSNFLRPHVTAGDIEADLAAASPDVAQVYRTSAANSILAKIESARGSATGKADLLSRIYDSVGGRAKLRALFPSEAAADAFETKMDALATENATRRFVGTGSQTTDKAAQLVSLGGGRALPDIGKGVYDVGMGLYNPVKAIGAGIESVGSRIMGNTAERNATALAPSLVSPNVSSLLQKISADNATREAAARAAGLLAPRAAGILAGVLPGFGRPGDVR